MKKIYITAQELLEASFRLANQIYVDGFRPQFIVGIWRGGTPIGIAVQEYFEYKGVSTDHIAVRTSSYYGIDKQHREIRIYGLNYIIDNANSEDSLLIVDDVFDSGRSVDALIKKIRSQMRLNTPKDIRVACTWYKPSRCDVEIKPDYYTHKNDDWLIFPHELVGLSLQEISEGKADLANIVDLF
jgi:hypothetical protein